MNNGKPRAVSKWFQSNGNWEWRPCTVVGFDEKEQKFQIQWDTSDKKKFVSRFLQNRVGYLFLATEHSLD